MKFKKILLIYKHSAYRNYFMNPNSSILQSTNKKLVQSEKKRLREAHDNHYKTLGHVTATLKKHDVTFEFCYRGKEFDFRNFDLIITVGGDGTFLEASRNAKNHVMLGVNSSPNHSVGRFCIANAKNFERLFKKIIAGDFKIGKFHRITGRLGRKESFDALNDILVCHRNPAALCRYHFEIGKGKEEQRSSGVWISTAVGSSGALSSAGGKKLHHYDKKFVYHPRELYRWNAHAYKFKGSVLSSKQTLTVTSLMRRGMIYVDGAHKKFTFNYGSNLKVSLSKNPIRTISL